MYPPLDYLNDAEYPGAEFDKRIELLIKAGLEEAKDITFNEYLRTFMNLNLQIGTRIKVFNSDFEKNLCMLLLLNTPNFLEERGFTPADVRSGRIDISTEWMDNYIIPVLLDEWAKNKQVFKPDPAFAKALLSTKDLQFTREMIDHLPCLNFYVDLLDCKMFNPIKGVFVDIRKDLEPNMVYMTFNAIMSNPANSKSSMVSFSFYTRGMYNTDGKIDLSVDDFMNRGYSFWSPEKEIREKLDVVNANKPDAKMAFLVTFQMIAYLTLEKPEITDNPVTKSTYRRPSPGAKPKNRFSEIEIHDVGIRYGKIFQKQLEDYKKSVNDQEKTESESGKRHHKSPVAHFRCAHWHTYRYGKGRQFARLQWQEPTFVCGRNPEITEAQDVVIHKVKA